MADERDDVELHYEETGDGEPLIFLHGFLGCGADWRHLFPRPPAGHRIVAPDLRGHGRSPNPSGAYSHRLCASDVASLLDRLGIRRAKAIGISGGGIVLLHLATREPARIGAMVLVSAPPYFPEQARLFQRTFSADALGATDLALMRQRHPRPGQLDRLLDQARAFADSYDDVNFTPPLLSRISAETLVVFGDRDPLYPAALALELRQAIPRSYLWVVPNGGHAPVFGEAAAPFARAVEAFLGGHWQVPAS
jgi:pimeloyl-ACP methyl ester carboxylesterase